MEPNRPLEIENSYCRNSEEPSIEFTYANQGNNNNNSLKSSKYSNTINIHENEKLDSYDDKVFNDLTNSNCEDLNDSSKPVVPMLDLSIIHSQSKDKNTKQACHAKPKEPTNNEEKINNIKKIQSKNIPKRNKHTIQSKHQSYSKNDIHRTKGRNNALESKKSSMAKIVQKSTKTCTLKPKMQSKNNNPSTRTKKFMVKHGFDQRKKSGVYKPEQRLLGDPSVKSNNSTLLKAKRKSCKESIIDHILNNSSGNKPGNVDRMYQAYRSTNNNASLKPSSCKYSKSRPEMYVTSMNHSRTTKAKDITRDAYRSFVSRNNGNKNLNQRPKSSVVRHNMSHESNFDNLGGQRSESVNERFLLPEERNKLRVVNISLDQMDNYQIAETYPQSLALSKDSHQDEIMRKLSPNQRQEILRIREEGKSRCQQIINQIDIMKSKASDRAIETSERNRQSQNDEYIKTIAGNYEEILRNLKNNEVSSKLKDYESRMKSFENEIHNMHLNMSQQNLILSQNLQSNYASPPPNKGWSSSLAEPNLVYQKRILDDSVNYQSKDSIALQNILSNKCGSYSKPCPGKPNQNAPEGVNKTLHHKKDSGNSLCLINSLNDFESSPILQENLIKSPNKEICLNLEPYHSLNNKSTSINQNSTDQSSILLHEEIKICQMEIELLQKKLKYYRTQLENLGEDNTNDWELMIQTIQRQLSEKVQELAQKKAKRDSISAQAYTNQYSNYESVHPPRLSGIERRRKRLDNQLNHLNMLSHECEEEINLTHESRLSISSMMSNFSIPNEHEIKPQSSSGAPQLSNMLMNYQILNKPMVDFGASPEKNMKNQRKSIKNTEKDTIKPQNSQYIRVKHRYRNLKESMQFHPKNCFNRDK
ncbi:unnamed protein product [Moneuplotes crassus]|uniref:Uncharacterized protein n=1 Tax=Euplotes crassus TaxID=5936 RepID=A0AAD2D8X9_EUPCR|nr:unnamed protein product [Moneuplotes crassus]